MSLGCPVVVLTAKQASAQHGQYSNLFWQEPKCLFSVPIAYRDDSNQQFEYFFPACQPTQADPFQRPSDRVHEVQQVLRQRREAEAAVSFHVLCLPAWLLDRLSLLVLFMKKYFVLS